MRYSMSEHRQSQPVAIFLMGPTAAGKSALALLLSRYIPVEIISVDSALVYRGMNIGTAKPSTSEQLQVPHHLLDIRDVAQSYSAAEFRRDALPIMQEITRRGRIPLLAGGTMLYFKALLDGLSPLPAADTGVRAQIEQQASEHGWLALHQRLQAIDPQAALRIHPNDPQRLCRALEVFLISGKTLTELTRIQGESLPYQVYQFAIVPASRELLHQRIAQRFQQMLMSGFEQEVRALWDRGDLHANLPSVRCVGYRQMWSYLAGETTYDEMVWRGVCATRQLAKRQLTWLRGWHGLHWLNSDNFAASCNEVLQVIDVKL